MNWKYLNETTHRFSLADLLGGTKYAPEYPRAVCNSWLWIERDGRTLIHDGYAWDGATGVPDFAFLKIATLRHDALYQFAEEIATAWGWTVWQVLAMADTVFERTALADARQPWQRAVARLYTWGVRRFGYAFHVIRRALSANASGAATAASLSLLAGAGAITLGIVPNDGGYEQIGLVAVLLGAVSVIYKDSVARQARFEALLKEAIATMTAVQSVIEKCKGHAP